MSQSDIAIVGAGHGGAQAAIALRQGDFKGSITLISDERDVPYERPPLLKEYLAGEKTFGRLIVRPPGYWMERKIKLRLGERATQVIESDPEISLSRGERNRYGSLIWAAGGSPRRLTCSGG